MLLLYAAIILTAVCEQLYRIAVTIAAFVVVAVKCEPTLKAT